MPIVAQDEANDDDEYAVEEDAEVEVDGEAAAAAFEAAAPSVHLYAAAPEFWFHRPELLHWLGTYDRELLYAAAFAPPCTRLHSHYPAHGRIRTGIPRPRPPPAPHAHAHAHRYGGEPTRVNGRFAYALRRAPDRMLWWSSGYWHAGLRTHIGEQTALLIAGDAALVPEQVPHGCLRCLHAFALHHCMSCICTRAAQVARVVY